MRTICEFLPDAEFFCVDPDRDTICDKDSMTLTDSSRGNCVILRDRFLLLVQARFQREKRRFSKWQKRVGKTRLFRPPESGQQASGQGKNVGGRRGSRSLPRVRKPSPGKLDKSWFTGVLGDLTPGNKWSILRALRAYTKTPAWRRPAAKAGASVALSRHIAEDIPLSGALPPAFLARAWADSRNFRIGS